jgi:polyisoprenoid-binding protein YceI
LEVVIVRQVLIIGWVTGLMLATATTHAAPVLQLPAGALEIVPGDSSVTFDVPDNRGGFSGHTTKVTGQVAVASTDGETYTARVTVSIDTPSITTDNGIRDSAMRSVYLQTADHPEITFVGTATASPGLGVHPFPATIAGQLTIKGTTEDVHFSGTITALDREYLADASTTIRMADYHIPYPHAFIFVAHDPVTVKIHIRARQP